jgi:hypothetical protein
LFDYPLKLKTAVDADSYILGDCRRGDSESESEDRGLTGLIVGVTIGGIVAIVLAGWIYLNMNKPQPITDDEREYKMLT